ncbi:surface-associated interspersed protein 14.1 (SURFIN 14.1), partial [Plasmodium gaboni]
MNVARSIPKSKISINTSTYSLIFSLFFARLKDYVTNRIREVKTTDNHKKECRHLNYEIDEAQELFTTNDTLTIPRSVREHSWKKQIEKYLQYTLSKNSENKCKRIYPFYQRVQRNRRKMLEDYCEERDRKKDEIDYLGNPRDKCLEFNNWIISQENLITNAFNNKLYGDDQYKQAYNICSNCTLRNPGTLFKKMVCKTEEEEKKNDKPENGNDPNGDNPKVVEDDDGGGKKTDEENEEDEEEEKHPETPNNPAIVSGSDFTVEYYNSNIEQILNFKFYGKEFQNTINIFPTLSFDRIKTYILNIVGMGDSSITPTKGSFNYPVRIDFTN